MIRSVCIETIFTEVPFEERFELAKQSGFDYVEFWSWKDKDIDNRSANFRIALFNSKNCGQGIGREAIDMTLQFGFEKLNLHRIEIELEVFSFN